MRLCCNVPEVDTAAAVEHSPAAAGEDSLAGIGPVEEGNSLGEVVGGTYIHKTQIRYHFQAQKKKKKEKKRKLFRRHNAQLHSGTRRNHLPFDR